MLRQRELDVPALPAFLLIPRHPIRKDHLPDARGVGRRVGDGVDLGPAAALGFRDADQLAQIRFILIADLRRDRERLRLDALLGLGGRTGVAAGVLFFERERTGHPQAEPRDFIVV